ncbi:H-NS histone family protein [Pontitalea aquivivens]|uniref:H-NS histone family protein n=1 Tax=Pontitalea aquivivens TaxID=3388663 RepID=UPI003970A4FF
MRRLAVNIDSLSLNELKTLRAQVDRAIATYEDRRKKEALAELEDVARRMGFSLPELMAMQGGRKRKPGTAKYANPADPAQTWTGRGRKPNWVTQALNAGKSLSDLAI